MQSHFLSRFSLLTVVLLASTVLAPGIYAQYDGEADLDKAIDLKLNAKSARDFDRVAALCESAIEKGLEEESIDMAKQVWASALYEYAALQGKKILEQIPPDRRWQFLRQQAMTRLDEAVELSPEFTDAYMLIARLNIMLPNGDKDAARTALGKVLELSDENPGQKAQSLVLRSQLTDDPEQAIEDLNEALEVDAKNALALRLRGMLFLEQGESDKAIADFQALAETQNDNPATFLLLAQTLANNDQTEEALKFINQAIEINPDIPEAYQLRARLHMAKDDDDAAMADVEKTLELNPRDPSALFMQANFLFEREQYDEALKTVDKLLLFQPGTVGAIYLRSFIYAQLEKYDQAIDDMKQLADFDPDNPQWQNDLAMMYNAAERPRKAIEIYSAVLEQDGDNHRALRGRGDARLSTGEHKKAIEDYERALKLIEEDDGLLNNLAWVLATSPEDDLRDGKRSIELGLKACELTDYKKAHILSTLAAGYAEVGDFETAIKWATEAVDKAESDKQRGDLTKELESYHESKPWRERQTIEDSKPDRGGGELKTDEQLPTEEKTKPPKSGKKKEGDKSGDGKTAEEKDDQKESDKNKEGDKKQGDKQGGDGNSP